MEFEFARTYRRKLAAMIYVTFRGVQDAFYALLVEQGLSNLPFDSDVVS